jgi:hypothetical protein
MNQSARQQAEMMAAAERVMARADALAAISETAEGLTRVYLSPQHLQANQQVARWMTQAGMTVWQDSVGNICGRYEGEQEGRRPFCWGLIWIRYAMPGAMTACWGCSRRLMWWKTCISRGVVWRKR